MVTGDELALRAHNLLCLQGFRGKGYSEGFVARMSAVHARLAQHPETVVRVLAGPDTLCDACPHLAGGCTLGGPGHESHMRAQDDAVLRRLDLAAGSSAPWSDLLQRLGRAIRPVDLPEICTTCPWLPLGYCAEGVAALRSPSQGGPGP